MVEKKEKSKINKLKEYLEWTLLSAMFITGITFICIGRFNSALGIISSAISAILIREFLKKKKIGTKYMLAIYVFFWLNVLGELLIYPNINYFDKLLHFSSGILIAMIIYDYFKKNIKVDILAIYLACIGLFAIWEIFDWILYVYFGFKISGVWIRGEMIMNPYDDSTLDIVSACVGSLVYLIYKKK
jgi:uncharacterized membrane protein YjdF